MDRAQGWVAGISMPIWIGAAVLAAVLPLIGTAWTTGLADVGLVLVAVAGGVAGTTGAWVRYRLEQLPLAFAEHALEGRINGRPVFRFRVRLGLGRVMRNGHAEVVWEGEDGSTRVLEPVLAAAPILMGPWTVVVVDHAQQCTGAGAFLVKVRAEEGDKTWKLERRFLRQGIQLGRFGPGLRQQAGHLVFDPSTFDTVIGAETAP